MRRPWRHILTERLSTRRCLLITSISTLLLSISTFVVYLLSEYNIVYAVSEGCYVFNCSQGPAMNYADQWYRDPSFIENCTVLVMGNTVLWTNTLSCPDLIPPDNITLSPGNTSCYNGVGNDYVSSMIFPVFTCHNSSRELVWSLLLWIGAGFVVTGVIVSLITGLFLTLPLYCEQGRYEQITDAWNA